MSEEEVKGTRLEQIQAQAHQDVMAIDAELESVQKLLERLYADRIELVELDGKLAGIK